MTPLVFISGVFLGTAFSIFFGLAVVALLMAMLGTETPRVAAEIKPLLSFSALFLTLTVTSAVGFLAVLKKHRLKLAAQVLMWSSWIIAIIGLLLFRD